MTVPPWDCALRFFALLWRLLNLLVSAALPESFAEREFVHYSTFWVIMAFELKIFFTPAWYYVVDWERLAKYP